MTKSKEPSDNHQSKIKNQGRVRIKSNISKDNLDDFRNEVVHLSYEESLEALDNILEKLQADNIPVSQLQIHFRKGNIYLNHCRNILENIEQEIVEVSPDEL